MQDVIAKVIPIFALIMLGYGMRQKNIMTQEMMDGLKKLVLNFALPAVLFVTFLKMEMKASYLVVSVGIFTLCLSLMLLGILYYETKIIKSKIFPFMGTSFSFGLLGIGLFSTVFGLENLNYFAVFGIGHEVFMWFIYMLVIRVRLNDEKLSPAMLLNFIKSPLIIAVMSGIALNVMGFSPWLHSFFITQGMIYTAEYLMLLANPLIFMIVGYGLEFDLQYTKESLKLVAIRYMNVLVLGYALKFFLLDRVMEANILFDYAYFTFLILPPPFSLSIFVGRYSQPYEQKLTNNFIVMNTLIGISVFIAFALWTTL